LPPQPLVLNGCGLSAKDHLKFGNVPWSVGGGASVSGFWASRSDRWSNNWGAQIAFDRLSGIFDLFLVLFLPFFIFYFQ